MRKHGLRIYQLKAIEDALLDLFYENEVGVSGLEQITFSVAKYSHTKDILIHGFLHVGDDCRMFNNVSALDVLFDEAVENRKHKILYQQFKGVLL